MNIGEVKEINEPGYPIIKQMRDNINDKPYDFLIEFYEDKLIFIVTEVDNVGSLIQVKVNDKDEEYKGHLIDQKFYEPSIKNNLINLLGHYSIYDQLYSNIISTLLLKGSKLSKGLPYTSCVIGLGIKHNKDDDYNKQLQNLISILNKILKLLN